MHKQISPSWSKESQHTLRPFPLQQHAADTTPSALATRYGKA